MFQCVLGAALHTEIVNDKQRIATELVYDFVPSGKAAVQVIQDSCEVRHAHRHFLLHQGVRNATGSTIPMSTGFDEWCWGQSIFYAGFGFTNWPNDVCNDLVLQKDGKCRFVCAEDNYRPAALFR